MNRLFLGLVALVMPLVIMADQAMPILRWFVPWLGAKPKLQQQWKKDDGTYEWRTVPTDLNWDPKTVKDPHTPVPPSK